MAQTSFPFENIDTSETQFSQWARNIGEGVKQSSGDELVVYADSTGMNVKVGTGQAMVRGHYYTSTAEETLTVTASDPTNPRKDNVVLELDPSANSILLKVVAGTPASSPSAPSVVQTDGGVYQIKLAEVLVSAGVTTIAADKVTDTRTMLATAADLAGDLATLESTVSSLSSTVATKVEKTNGTVTTAATGSTVVRNITLSTSDPSGGSDGEVWLKYTA